MKCREKNKEAKGNQSPGGRGRLDQEKKGPEKGKKGGPKKEEERGHSSVFFGGGNRGGRG